MMLMQLKKMLILPTSLTGRPRYMRQHFLDAMAICNQMGCPNFFVMFTCNPNWSKIQKALSQQPGIYASYQPNTITRVFRLRLKELKRDFKEINRFGKVIAGIIAF